jgi:hypothetical protein
MTGPAIKSAIRTATLLGALLFLQACASGAVSNTIPEGDFRDRLQTQEKAGIVVTTGVPSAKESRELFGKPLYKQGIQPVWLEIQNSRSTRIGFLPVGLDPEYFTPLEAANMDVKEHKVNVSDSLVNEFFVKRGLEGMTIDAGETRQGFMFTKLDEGTKAFNVDIIGTDDDGENEFKTFTFFVPIPGLNIDHYNVDWQGLYADSDWMDFEKDRLIEEIEKFPCCVKDKKGENNGDPLNLIIIGRPMDIYTAFIRAGWDETESVTRASSMKTIASFLSGGEYRYSPVSSLYVFGRPQDVAFQKARDNIHERNHLRLWMSRVTFQGLPVWIGQISRDIGVRFTRKSITTHKIDPNVDETREYLLENLAYAQSLKASGYVGGVGEVSWSQPQGNLTGDPWFSDGYRLVLWLSSEPVAISDLTLLDWRHPYRSD